MSVNEHLAEKLSKSFYETFKDNIWVADLAETGSLSSKVKNVKYLLCIIDLLIKYACVKHFKKVKQFLMVLSKY